MIAINFFELIIQWMTSINCLRSTKKLLMDKTHHFEKNWTMRRYLREMSLKSLWIQGLHDLHDNLDQLSWRLLNARLHKRIRTCLCSGDVDFGCRSGRETQENNDPRDLELEMDGQKFRMPIGWSGLNGFSTVSWLWEDGKSRAWNFKNRLSRYREFNAFSFPGWTQKVSSSLDDVTSLTFFGESFRGCLKMLVFSAYVLLMRNLNSWWQQFRRHGQNCDVNDREIQETQDRYFPAIFFLVPGMLQAIIFVR